MKKNKSNLIILLMFLLLFLIIISENSQKKINWYPSFSVNHKIPYGSYIAFEEARQIFKDSMQPVQVSPYVFLSDKDEKKGTYLLYNTSVGLGETNLKSLLNWVEKGNSLMIAANDIDTGLLDSLHLKIKYFYHPEFKNNFRFVLHHNEFKNDTAFFDKFNKMQIIDIQDSISEHHPLVLGSLLVDKKDSLYNFVRFNYGKGYIYLHTFPYVFTNYFILKKQNVHYFEGILSYLNLQKPLYWDVHIQNGATSKGIYSYITERKALLWSYRLLFLGLLLFIIFEGKRKQRPIPIVNPPRNETLEFTKTIADMYIENKEHKAIAMLHIKHFLEYIRTQLHLDTRILDNDLMKKISQKTKTDMDTVKALFEKINQIQQSENIRSKELSDLEKLIEKIKKK